MKRSRRYSAGLAVVAFLAVLLPFQGAASLPSYSLSAYRFTNGVTICDPAGDSNPGYSDIDCNSTESASVYVGSDGTSMAGAFVLNADPRSSSSQAPFSSNAYVIQVASGGVHLATLGVDAKGTGDSDEIYAKCAGNATLTYQKTLSTALIDGDADVSAEPTGIWRVTFVVPLAPIASCGITATTPVQLFFGTSQAGNLDVINKDFMTGSDVSFANLATITFGGSLEISSTLAVVSGPEPPVVGQTTAYDVTIVVSNTGANTVTGVSVTDAIPAGVTVVSVISATGSAGVSGSDVTWNGFDLNGGTSATLVVRVSITPVASQIGSTVSLDGGASASGTGGSGPVTADAAPLTTGPVGGANVTISKVASPAAVNAGDEVTYTITIANTGTDAATVDSVTDALPSGFAFVPGSTSGTLGAGAPSSVSPSVIWTGPFALPAGSSRTLVFDATAGSVGGAFSNTGSASIAGVGDITTGPVATVTVNAAPSVQDDGVSTPANTPVVIEPLNNDSDPEGALDPSTLTIVTGPSSGTATVDGLTGTITYAPAPGFDGLVTIEYRVCDTGGACGTATITIAVGAANLPPTASDDDVPADEDTPVVFQPAANDTDSDGTLDLSSLTIVTGPTDGLATVSGSDIQYVPGPNFNGTDTLEYRICDDQGACDVATVTMTVNAVNDVPVAVDDAASTPEDSSVDVAVLGNDSDPDGPLAPASLAVLAQPSNGTVTVGVPGVFTYTPAPDFNGVDSFTYQVCDADLACDVAIVTITVNPVNDMPVAAQDQGTTSQDKALVVVVLDNDDDPDGDTLTVGPIGSGSHGSAATNENDTVTFTPAKGFVGTDQFTYQACDPSGECAPATVTVNVLAASGEIGSVRTPTAPLPSTGTSSLMLLAAGLWIAALGLLMLRLRPARSFPS